jgi:hypothetical protein
MIPLIGARIQTDALGMRIAAISADEKPSSSSLRTAAAFRFVVMLRLPAGIPKIPVCESVPMVGLALEVASRYSASALIRSGLYNDITGSPRRTVSHCEVRSSSIRPVTREIIVATRRSSKVTWPLASSTAGSGISFTVAKVSRLGWQAPKA